MSGYLSEAFVSFQGEGLHVGRRHLFVRFAGCPLRCRYCDTPESLVRTESFAVHATTGAQARPNPVAVSDVEWALGVLTTTGDIDAVAITGGEPLAQVDFLAELLRADILPRPRLLETAGMLPRNLERVLDAVEIVSMDLKLPSNSGETAFWSEHEEFLRVAAGKVYVKILIDENTTDPDFARGVELIGRVNRRTPLFLQPITATGGEVVISSARLDALYTAARASLDDVRVLPQTHKIMRIQ